MCEFCVEHGEGKKWYLEAKNYGEDLLADAKRKGFLRRLVQGPFPSGSELNRQMEKLDKAPSFVRRAIRWKTVRSKKKLHYGQIVPIEDVERIFDFVNSIVRISCLCRHIMLGQEKRYCYGISMGPNGGMLGEIYRELGSSFMSGPDSKGTEVVSKEEALSNFREYENEGLCHSVWTFRTPCPSGKPA